MFNNEKVKCKGEYKNHRVVYLYDCSVQCWWPKKEINILNAMEFQKILGKVERPSQIFVCLVQNSTGTPDQTVTLWSGKKADKY